MSGEGTLEGVATSSPSGLKGGGDGGPGKVSKEAERVSA